MLVLAPAPNLSRASTFPTYQNNRASKGCSDVGSSRIPRCVLLCSGAASVEADRWRETGMAPAGDLPQGSKKHCMTA